MIILQNKKIEDFQKTESDLTSSLEEFEICKNELRDEIVRMTNDNVQKEKQFTKSNSFDII